MSTEQLINGIWDVFSPSLEDNSTSYYQWTEQQESMNNASPNNLSQIVYQMNQLNDYYLPAEAFIYIRGKIWNGAIGTAYTNSELVSLRSAAISQFSDAKLYFNSVCVEQKLQSQDALSLAYNIMNLREYSKDKAYDAGSEEFFYPDEGMNNYTAAGLSQNGQTVVNTTSLSSATASFLAPSTAGNTASYAMNVAAGANGALTLSTAAAGVGGAVQLNPLSPNPSYNRGFYHRWLRTLNSQVFTMAIPLKRLFGFLRDHNKAIRGPLIRVELFRNNTVNQTLQYAATLTPIYQILYTSVWIPVVRPSLSIEAALNMSYAANTKQIMKWNNWELYFTTFGATSSLNWQIIANALKPRYLHVFFKNQTNLLTNIVLDNLNITQASLLVNSEVIPSIPYQIDTVTNMDWMRPYNDFLALCGKSMHGDLDNAPSISYNEYANTYFILSFDLTSKEMHTRFDSQTPVSLVFRAIFSANVPANVNAYAILENEREITVEGLGNGINFIM